MSDHEKLQVFLTVDGGGVGVELILINIPGAWQVQTTEPVLPDEHPGVGVGRFDAVADWIGKNWSRNKIPMKEMCAAAFKTALERATPERQDRLLAAIVRELTQ